MKKIVILSFLFLVCSQMPAHALTQLFACTSGGNWSGSIWVTSTGAQAACTGGTTFTVADEAVLNASSGQVTVTASTSAGQLLMSGYASTLTINSGQTLTLNNSTNTIQATLAGTGTIESQAGGVTLGATPSGGTTVTLLIDTAAQTLTSGGFTWPGPLTDSYAGTTTLSGAWTTSGLTTLSGASLVLSGSSTNKYKANGGLTMTAAMASSTAYMEINGGTWSGNFNVFPAQLTIGTITVSGVLPVSSTVMVFTGSSTITNSSATLIPNGASFALTTNSVTWPGNLSNYIFIPIALTGNLTVSGTIYTNAVNSGFSGAYNVTTANLIGFCDGGSSGSSTFKIAASQTLTVTNSITLLGNLYTISNTGVPSQQSLTMASGTASTAFNLNYTGTMANENISGVIFTDVNASGSTVGILNYHGQSLTRTTNITNIDGTNTGMAAGI